MFKAVERNQKCILPPVLSDLIPDDDIVEINRNPYLTRVIFILMQQMKIVVVP